MITKMFQPKFHDLVKEGKKLQTIRPKPKNPKYLPQVGQDISLRKWTGKPYRSPQEVLASGEITSVEPVCIDRDAIKFPLRRRKLGVHLITELKDLNRFAREDGFEDWQDLQQWFQDNHGPVARFRGVLIQWKLTDNILQPQPTQMELL